MAVIEQAYCVQPKNSYRLVVLGSSKVGKTSIISRFLTDEFTDSYVPTIENFHRKVYRIRRKSYRLDIIDTAGHFPNEAARRLLYLTGDMFLIVYNITQRETFEAARQIYQQIIDCKQLYKPGSITLSTPIVLVGNKLDQEVNRVVILSEAGLVVKNFPSAGVLETSAKDNYKTDEIFSLLFSSAQLPPEMTSALHRKVTPSYVIKNKHHGEQVGNTISCFRKISEATGLVVPFARRPSVNADMQQVQTDQNSQCRSGKKRGLNRRSDESACALQ